MVTDSRRVQWFDAYVTYTATRTVDGADERAAIGANLIHDEMPGGHMLA